MHEIGLSYSDVDPFDKVIGSSTHGRVQLYGRGVSMKNLKQRAWEEKGSTGSFVLEEYVDAIRCNLATKMQKDYESQKRKIGFGNETRI